MSFEENVIYNLEVLNSNVVFLDKLILSLFSLFIAFIVVKLLLNTLKSFL